MDLNAVVTAIRSRLRRAVPADVDIVLDLDQSLAPVNAVPPQIEQVHHNLAPLIAPVNADPAQIVQVLLNLVLNGRDAMPSGGRLVIRTDVPPPAALSRAGARPRTNPGWLRLQVEDTGEGMDAETLERI